MKTSTYLSPCDLYNRFTCVNVSGACSHLGANGSSAPAEKLSDSSTFRNIPVHIVTNVPGEHGAGRVSVLTEESPVLPLQISMASYCQLLQLLKTAGPQTLPLLSICMTDILFD